MQKSERRFIFVLRGFPPGTVLRIDGFDPPPTPSVAGTLTTTGYDAFTSTPLEVIEPLEHDELSLYELPGNGRLRNYLFAARPTAGPLAGRDAMVFISLIDDGSLEARVLVGNGDETAGGHFGLFRLRRL